MSEPLEDVQGPETELPEHLQFLSSEVSESEEVVVEEPEAAPAPAPHAEPEGQELPAGLRRELSELRADRRGLREKLEQITQSVESMRQQWLEDKKPKPQPDESLNPDSPVYDPARHILHGVEQQTGQVIERLERVEGALTQKQLMEQVQQFYQDVNRDVEQVRSTASDYDDAVDYARMVLANYLRGKGVPEDKIDEAVEYEEKVFALQNKRAGKNPAEEIYKFAKESGYVPVANGNGTKPAQPAPLTGRAAAVQRGIQESKPAGGRPARPNAGINPETFLSLSEAEQSKIASDYDAWQAMMAGNGYVP